MDCGATCPNGPSAARRKSVRISISGQQCGTCSGHLHSRRDSLTFRFSMRQRTVTQRIFTALFGIWFSLLLAEPVTLHACPMHDGPLAHAAAQHAAVRDGSTALPDGRGDVLHASSAHQQSSTDHPLGHGNHQCQCLGCCAGTSAISLPAFPLRNLQATYIATQARHTDAGDALREAMRFEHALPFANGPPDHTQLVS
jgi:hypothetical protein